MLKILVRLREYACTFEECGGAFIFKGSERVNPGSGGKLLFLRVVVNTNIFMNWCSKITVLSCVGAENDHIRMRVKRAYFPDDSGYT